jgi:hypothetical protein
MGKVKKSDRCGRRIVKKLVKPIKLKICRLGKVHGNLSRGEIYETL